MAELAVIGSIVSSIGTIASGAAAKKSAYYQAAQYDAKAAEEKAAAQREAQQQDKETKLVLSRQQAINASSGLGATDDTVEKLAGDTAAYGAYRSGMTRYGGDERAAGLRGQATGSRMSGDAALTGALFNAAGTVLGSFATPGMVDKYGEPFSDWLAKATGAPLDLTPGPNQFRYRLNW